MQPVLVDGDVASEDEVGDLQTGELRELSEREAARVLAEDADDTALEVVRERAAFAELHVNVERLDRDLVESTVELPSAVADLLVELAESEVVPREVRFDDVAAPGANALDVENALASEQEKWRDVAAELLVEQVDEFCRTAGAAA